MHGANRRKAWRRLLVVAVGGLVYVGVASAAPWTETPATQPASAVPPTQPVTAPSRITAITVYQANALVTREVSVPEKKGPVEVVVGPLPATTINSSLYSEGGDGLRVLTTRYRTRVVQENTADEVRKLEAQIKELHKDDQQVQRDIAAMEANLQLLSKLENFASTSAQQMTEKATLNADAVTAVTKYIMEQRTLRTKEVVMLQQRLQQNQEQAQFLQREMSKVAQGGDKTIREAVIVVDNDKGGAGKVRLNYLVSQASWRPNYKLRASKDPAKPEVSLEYLAAIYQQSGEDWTDVDMVLSTAQPLLNAAPPDLAMLEVGTNAPGKGVAVTVNGGTFNLKSELNRRQAEQFRQEAQVLSNSANKMDADRRFNDAAAYQQSDEILNPMEPQQMKMGKPGSGGGVVEGQSVTFHLDRRLSVPWRDDEQLIEVARLAMKPDYFYKAVPVLTPHVYRLANLTNDSKYVILPGEATSYLDTDFVGRASLPLVAIGEQFTAGFGVDPQLQVARQLVEKTRTIQGGNQVLKFDYRISVSSYKNEAVKLQLWDRLPHSETEAVNVTLLQTSREQSTDPEFVREQKPKNLLRWDMTVEPGMKGEKAASLSYQFKLEFAKDAAIGNFLSK